VKRSGHTWGQLELAQDQDDWRALVRGVAYAQSWAVGVSKVSKNQFNPQFIFGVYGMVINMVPFISVA